MIRHTSGIICAPMSAERAERLNLPPMVANNLDPMRTAFTVSVDFRADLTTGISGIERTDTVRALASESTKPLTSCGRDTSPLRSGEPEGCAHAFRSH